MSKKTLLVAFLVVLGVVIVLLLITPLAHFLKSYSSYYRACESIVIGMSGEKALDVMRPYEQYFGREIYRELTGETELLYSSKGGDNCRIYVRDGVVSDREVDFD